MLLLNRIWLSESIVLRINIVIVLSLTLACNGAPPANSNKFYTWDGLEPDRWATVWLMNRHITQGAHIDIVPVGVSLSNSTVIATPHAEITRTHGKSTYENMLAAYNIDDDHALSRIGNIINRIEISPWAQSSPTVSLIERQFRNLQYDYNRVNVPISCYSGFFDSLYSELQESETPDLHELEAALAPSKVCSNHKGVIANNPVNRVFEYSTDHVLNLIASERKVVFVDTRENDEFKERRIPGAINLKLREVNEESVAQIKDADLVIAYCIKDFRGYEVALAMSKAGVSNVGIMNPFGLKGWIDQGLPIVDSNVTEARALDLLREKALTGV